MPELRLLLFDRLRACPGFATATVLSCVPFRKLTSKELPRAWLEGGGVDDVVVGTIGEGKREDFGLLFGGAGDGDCLIKGLFRTVPIVKAMV